MTALYVGAVVHVAADDVDGSRVCLAAMVTKVWPAEHCDLDVFLGGSRKAHTMNPAPHDEDHATRALEDRVITWHWAQGCAA